MQDELKKFIYLIILLVIVLAVIVISSKLSYINYNDDCSIISYKDGKKLCFGSDAGIKANHETAKNYCEKLNMRLPNREEVWYVWLASENCNMAFASGAPVAKNMKSFMDSEGEKVQSLNVKNYCREVSSIKFSQGLQYKDGYFWLGEFAGGKRHYAINYSTGTIKVFKDKTDSLGVRCVR